jgi:uncharacterized membrane protein
MNRAFIYQNGTMSDLGTLHGGWSLARAINNLGDIVGESDWSVFVMHNGVMIDLNAAIEHGEYGYPIINQVSAINDRGQIVGAAYFNGRLHACLLTPIAAQ